MTLFRSHGRDACPISLWDLGSSYICGKLVPHVTFSHLASLARRRGPRYPVAGGDPCMARCLESSLARPVLARSWSQTATDGAWFSTTAILSDRDRPLRLCVLRPRGWFRAQNSVYISVATSPPRISLSVACWKAELDRYT